MEIKIDIEHLPTPDEDPDCRGLFRVALVTPSFEGVSVKTQDYEYGAEMFYGSASEAFHAAEQYLRGARHAMRLLNKGGVDEDSLKLLRMRREADELDRDQTLPAEDQDPRYEVRESRTPGLWLAFDRLKGYGLYTFRTATDATIMVEQLNKEDTQ